MKLILKLFILILAVVLVWNLLSIKKIPNKINYGASFSVFHSNELKLDWKKTLLAILDDLNVRNFRFSAHWPLTEPENDKFNFSELDYQIAEADKRNATYIVAVGRRLPGWPECHEPAWLQKQMSEMNDAQAKLEFRNEQILKYIDAVVTRYKNSAGLKYWQVENEPFLGFFAESFCGETDEVFLQQEIALVRKIDPTHPILVTDSGEFGQWYKAYRNGDVFGNSVYLYVWSAWFGPIRYPVGPSFFRIKQNLIDLIYGKKPKILIEMQAEPWLLTPIIDAPMNLLFQQMGVDRFKILLDISKKAGYSEQYMWGAEWWYWMKMNGHSEYWDTAKKLFD